MIPSCMPEPPLCPPREQLPPYIGRCADCGSPIFEGETYWETMTGQLYHDDCLDELPIRKWIELAGLVQRTA